MALKGNLTDLPIGNIFRMIFMEKKGGKLSVKSGESQIAVFFERGKILHAEQGKEIDSYRLKRVLTANRYMDNQQWNDVLKKSKETLQPLWVVAEEIIGAEPYHFILRRQVEHVLFSLLQWHEGDYEFDAESPIYLDRRLFEPIDGEILLMGVYSAIDEWNEMSDSLPTHGTLLSKNEGVIASSYELDKNEEYVLSIINDPITFGDILESSRLGVSETGKIVQELLDTTVLVEEEPFLNEKPHSVPFWSPAAARKLVPLIIMLGLLTSAVAVRNFFLPAPSVSIGSLKGKADILSTTLKLQSINKAIIYFYSLYGKLPDTTYTLVEEGFLTRKKLIDPWERNIVFKKKEHTYVLFSQGRNPEDPTDNIPIHLNSKTDR